MKEQLNELALFAGAGGGILGGKLLGWRTICAVEWDGYARDVLVARQNDGCLSPFPIWDDVQTFDGHPWRGRVDVVSGGFPCQDISAAGKGAGIEGERSGMWKHMARIIGEVLPQFVFVENSPMLVGRGLAVVLADLAKMGYDAQWGVVGAHHVAAPHKRDRIWIVGTMGNTDDYGQAAAEKRGSTPQGSHASPPRKIEAGQSARPSEQLSHVADTASSQNYGIRGNCECGRNTLGRTKQAAQQDHGAPDHHRACGCGKALANAESTRLERHRGDARESEISEPWNHGASMGDADEGGRARRAGTIRQADGRRQSEDAGWWATEPDVGRVAHGVAARVDRLRCIGNGQVPAVAKLAWETLKP